MGSYLNKKMLYDKIDRLRSSLGIDNSSYPLNAISICRQKNIIIEYCNYKSKCLRGYVSIAKNSDEKSVIILSKERSDTENNFYGMHEFAHTELHSHIGTEFHCFEQNGISQNTFIEYQANEAAGEMLAPYREILPFLMWTKFKYAEDVAKFKEYLAKLFNVPSMVISYRLESLKWEIYQYIHMGVSIDNLQIISRRQQINQHINVQSLNDLEKQLPYEYRNYINNNSINPTFFKGNSWRP